MNKIYILRTRVKEETFYLEFLNTSATFAQYTKDLSKALPHTKEEMEYVKKHQAGLGRWVLLDSELYKNNHIK